MNHYPFDDVTWVTVRIRAKMGNSEKTQVLCFL
jgi:hypothetical protein